MKLQYIKILLFVIPLNILLTSYHAHNKNKPSITPLHTTRYTSRVLSECNIQSLNYDNDPQMKKVMKKFQDRTSQRLSKYDERMKEKRQKRKEQRDKNIEEIIEKYKKEKSLEQKIEKGCLKCGCALGGGVLPVWGLVSGLWYGTWLQYLSAKAFPAGIEAGIKKGLGEIIQIVEKSRGTYDITITVEEMLASGKFTKGVNLFDMVQHISTMKNKFQGYMYDQFFIQIDGMVEEGVIMFNAQNSANIAAVAKAVEEGEALKVAEFAANTSLLSNTIIASVVTIVIIVLILVIIYLILRYRRKKKMKKKAQYTKLLNE
ncbi:rifin PIR protein,putative [Plasmodium sp. DRC-Itaito]|nr:rifin PIR protein,putative [Plasmodium sp. DRC-Itaito]